MRLTDEQIDKVLRDHNLNVDELLMSDKPRLVPLPIGALVDDLRAYKRALEDIISMKPQFQADNYTHDLARAALGRE